jgi:predicted PurR-regulated permease PerM
LRLTTTGGAGNGDYCASEGPQPPCRSLFSPLMITRPKSSQTERFGTLISVALILIVVAVLYFMRDVFVPLALALLFSFLLAPLVTRFERWRLPRVPAVLLAVLLAFGVIGGIAYLVGGQVVDLTYKLPSYKANISRRIASLKSSGHSPLSDATLTVKELGEQISGTAPEPSGTRPDSLASADKNKIIPVEIVQPATNLTSVAQSVVGPVLGPLGTAAIVVVFVLFMLIKREDLRDRIIHLIGRGRLNVTTQALDEAAGKVTGYLTMQVIINVSFGVPIGVGLYLLGLPNAALWGLLATLLRFIPYVGAWIALGFPLLISLATTDTWRLPIETLALFGGIELVTSNVLEPWLYGAHTGLSPVAIMVATIFWTWLWGGVGLLLATPLTVCVAVLGKYIPSLSFLDALLGDEPTLTAEERYYQRLLALDRREASQIAENYLEENSLAALYSTLLVPALAAEEREDQNGGLDARHQRFIFDATREMVEELGGKTLSGAGAKSAKTSKANGAELGPPPPTATESLSKYPVFCLPAADEADEIVAEMLTQLLEQEGYKAESVSFKTLANEMVEQVAAAGCQTVCISATPPHDTLHTRYLCKLLRTRFPSLHIVVGLWDAEQSEDKLARRRERLTADKVVTTLQDALEQIRPFAVLESVPE